MTGPAVPPTIERVSSSPSALADGSCRPAEAAEVRQGVWSRTVIEDTAEAIDIPVVALRCADPLVARRLEPVPRHPPRCSPASASRARGTRRGCWGSLRVRPWSAVRVGAAWATATRPYASHPAEVVHGLCALSPQGPGLHYGSRKGTAGGGRPPRRRCRTPRWTGPALYGGRPRSWRPPASAAQHLGGGQRETWSTRCFHRKRRWAYHTPCATSGTAASPVGQSTRAARPWRASGGLGDSGVPRSWRAALSTRRVGDHQTSAVNRAAGGATSGREALSVRPMCHGPVPESATRMARSAM